MSNYVQTTAFTAKDSLPTGNANKIIKGAEFDIEFGDIQTAVATKADLNSPTFIGIPLVPTADAGTNTTQIASTAFVTTANLTKKTVLSDSTIDLSLGEVFSYTLPSSKTFVFTNTPATTNTSSGFVLELTNGGLYTVTWPATVKWPSGIAPALTVSGVDVLVFITLDNGTTWRGTAAIKDSK